MGGLGDHALAVQLRRPATLLPYRGMLRVGARNRAGSLRSGGRTFSSDTPLASPSVRKTFVLRDGRHSKHQFRIIGLAAAGSPNASAIRLVSVRVFGLLNLHERDCALMNSAAVGLPAGYSPALLGLVTSTPVGDHGALPGEVRHRTTAKVAVHVS